MQLNELRTALFSDVSERHATTIDLGRGRSVELRDPLYADIEAGQCKYKDRPIATTAYMVTVCTYVPGTEVCVFTLADMDTLLKAPVGGWLGRLMAEMGTKVKAAMAAGNAPSPSPAT